MPAHGCYAFDAGAARHVAIDSLIGAAASEKPDCKKLRIRTDNGNRHAGKDSRGAAAAPGITHEFIWKNTPGQTGMWSPTGRSKSTSPREFGSCQDAEAALADAFEDYKHGIHSAMGYVTPAKFAAQWRPRNK